MLKRLVVVCRRVFPIAAAFALFSSVAVAAPPDHLVIFGDSYSDNGNMYAKIGFPAPKDYTLARATDGADSTPSTAIIGLWDERVAPGLSMGAPQPNLSTAGGLNFSVGGAETSTYNNSVSGYGMAEQVSQYLGSSPAGIATGLHVFWGGINDLLDATDPASAEQAAIQNITSQITSVINAGGIYFVWVNVPPLDQTPKGAAATDAAALKTASSAFSTDMQTAIANLKSAHPGITIISVDAYSVFTKAIQNPSGYGFTNVTGTSQDVTGVNPDQYIFWDNVHPTTAMHRLIAQAAQTAITTALGAVPQSAPVSDDFSGSSLNTTLWTVRAPVGGTGSVSNGHLAIAVPGGSNHDPYVPALDAVQVLQSVTNSDFDVAIKLDSQIAASPQYAMQGLLIYADASDYLRYEVYTGGSGVGLYLASIDAGTSNTRLDTVPFSGYVVPTYLRMKRTGTTYTAYWSTDGANWTQAVTFTDGLSVSAMGPYGGNYNATPANAPALNVSVDWFHNLAAATAAATPSFNPGTESFATAPLSVSLSDATSGATIYYTTDGSTPITSSAVYSSPLSVSTTTTVNAMAVASGYSQSAVGSATYTYAPAQMPAATPSFNPGTESFATAPLSVSLSDATSGATIYYTTDGSTPSTSSTRYAGVISVSGTTTIKAIATASGFSQSAVSSATYTYAPVSTGGINYGSGFSSGSLSLNGSAQLSGTHLRLTDGGGYEASTAFYTTPVNVQAFTSNFSFQLTNPSADGFTFIVQGIGANALGSYGGALGYGPESAGGTGGIGSSFALKFDLYSNAGEGSDSTGLYTNGAYPTTPATDLTSTGVNLHSGDVFNVALSYNGTTLTVTITDTATNVTATQTYAVNIPSLVGGNTAYVGFGGGTGGLSATQDILTWTFSSQGATTPPPAAAATPSFNPGAESFATAPLSISLSDATSGATIYYTTDGSVPTTSSAVYSSPLNVSGTTTLNAIAVASGYSQSAVGSATYTYAPVQTPAATPTFNPGTESFGTAPISVSLSDTTSGAVIYYTTDGSTPSTSSTRYAGAISVSRTTTIKAVATASGYTQSAVGSATYTYAPAIPAAAAPTFSPGSETFTTTSLSVTLADSTSGSAIYYTTNGSTPTTTSTRYAGPITISSTTTIKAIATASGYTTSSMSSATYTKKSHK